MKEGPILFFFVAGVAAILLLVFTNFAFAQSLTVDKDFNFNSTRYVINAAGVSIGTATTQLGRLVLGTGGAIQFSDGTTQTTAAVAGGSGTVTSVGSGLGLTGGPITTTGILSLDLSASNVWSGQQTFNGGAQFPGSGVWNTSGNVGIGTASPAEALSIFGSGKSLELRHSATAPEVVRLYTDAVHQIIAGGSNDSLMFGQSNPAISLVTGGWTEWMRIQNGTGNVGIGTTNPGTKLDVNGNIWTGSAGSGRNVSYDLGAGHAAVGSSLYSYDGICAGESGGYCTGTGGVIIRSGAVQTGANVGLGGSGNSYFMGNVGIGTTGPTNKLEVNGTAAFTGDAWVGYNANGALRTRHIDGKQAGANGLDALYLQYNSPTFPVYVGQSTNNNNNLIVYGSVGVGVTPPSYKLDVSGDANATRLCIAGNCQSSWPAGGSGTVTSVGSGLGLTGGPITTSGILSLDLSASNVWSGQQTFNGGALGVRYNFVGVGGDSGNGAQYYSIYQEAGPWTSPYPDLRIQYHTGIKYDAYNGYGGHRFYTGYDGTGNPTGLTFSVGDGDQDVRVANNLLVGAVAGSPGARLEVTGGQIKVTDGGGSGFVDANGSGLLLKGGAGTIGAYIYDSNQWLTGTVSLGYTAAAAVPRLFVLGGTGIGSASYNVAPPTNGLIVEGNTGIGTSAPLVKLDVGPVGGAQTATTGALGLIRNSAPADTSPYTQARIIVYGGTGVDGTNWGYLAYGSDANMRIVYGNESQNHSLIFGTSDNFSGGGAFTPKMTINGSGNVGIGTTGPTNKLEVNGTAAFTGDAWVGYNANGALRTRHIDGKQAGANGLDALYLQYNSPTFPVYVGQSTNNNNNLIVYGSVGVGVTPSSYKLDVSGDANATRLCIAGNCQSSWPAGGSGTVTSVSSGLGLTGGPITTTGILSLDLSANNTWSGQQTFTGDVRVTNGYALFDDTYGVLWGGGTTGIQGSGSSNYIDFKTNNAVRLSIGNNGGVSIGGISPSGVPLEVKGLGDGTTAFRVVGSSHNNAIAEILQQSDTNTNTGALRLWTGNPREASPRVYISAGNTQSSYFNGGNVGIGTVSPSQKLTVVGTVESTSGGFKFPDGTTQTTSLSTANANTWSGGQTFSANTNFPGSGIWNTSGNLGIGTTNPTSPAGFSPVLRITGSIPSLVLESTLGSSIYELGVSSAGWLRIIKSGVATDRLNIDASGNVGIGMNAPTANLSVNGGVQFGWGVSNASMIADIGGTGTNRAICHSGAAAATDNVNIVDCTSAPSADVAEYYETNAGIEPGDVVIPSNDLFAFTSEGTLPYRSDKNLLVSKLSKSSRAYQSNVLGVVSSIDPKTIGDFTPVYGQDIKGSMDAKNAEPVALAGRTPVKVSLENGPIKVGDRLTSSSKSGVAMKATKSGMTIGIALEPFNGAIENGGVLQGKIMMFVNLSYFVPEN